MTDPNRGAYTPQSEAPLAFDARSARGPGDRPMPVTLLVSAGVFVLLVVALAFFFMKGMGEDPLRDAAVVGEPIEAIRTPPVDGGAPAQTNGLQVYTDNGASGPPAFTPGPEVPVARPAAPIVSTPLPPPAAAPAPAPAAAAPLPSIGEKAPVVAALSPVKAAPPPAAPSSAFVVQIGAFSSSAMADKGYADAGRLMSDQMGGKTKRVETVARDAGALYRTSIAGFAGRADADAFCSAYKAKGGNCLVRQ